MLRLRSITKRPALSPFCQIDSNRQSRTRLIHYSDRKPQNGVPGQSSSSPAGPTFVPPTASGPTFVPPSANGTRQEGMGRNRLMPHRGSVGLCGTFVSAPGKANGAPGQNGSGRVPPLMAGVGAQNAANAQPQFTFTTIGTPTSMPTPQRSSGMSSTLQHQQPQFVPPSRSTTSPPSAAPGSSTLNSTQRHNAAQRPQPARAPVSFTSILTEGASSTSTRAPGQWSSPSSATARAPQQHPTTAISSGTFKTAQTSPQGTTQWSNTGTSSVGQYPQQQFVAQRGVVGTPASTQSGTTSQWNNNGSFGAQYAPAQPRMPQASSQSVPQWNNAGSFGSQHQQSFPSKAAPQIASQAPVASTPQWNNTGLYNVQQPNIAQKQGTSPQYPAAQSVSPGSAIHWNNTQQPNTMQRPGYSYQYPNSPAPTSMGAVQWGNNGNQQRVQTPMPPPVANGGNFYSPRNAPSQPRYPAAGVPSEYQTTQPGSVNSASQQSNVYRAPMKSPGFPNIMRVGAQSGKAQLSEAELEATRRAREEKRRRLLMAGVERVEHKNPADSASISATTASKTSQSVKQSKVSDDFDLFAEMDDLMEGGASDAIVSAEGIDHREKFKVEEAEEAERINMERERRKAKLRMGVMGAEKKDTLETSESQAPLVRVYSEELEGPSRGRGKKGKADKRYGAAAKFVVDEAEILKIEEEKKRKEERAFKRKEKKKRDAAPLFIPEFISVQHLATSMKVPVPEFLTKMTELGFENTSHDMVLNAETASLISMEYGFEPIVEREGEDLKPRPPPEDLSILPPRPPIVTIMGHVDHGKTTLLDYLRKTSVAAGEFGGITQHIGAFSVNISSGKTITFLDTPGHAAFLNMRQRGANVTDIVVLVVAADDSVKPQTIEAIKHAKGANVPIIVAINKIDKPDADPERVKLDLGRHGVDVEDFGGDTQVVLVSGKTGQGMEDLEETILTLSEILDHRAETDGPVEGWVIEASTQKRGRVATVLVKRGTLRPGDIVVAGNTWARVRTLQDANGVLVDEASPGTPVEVDGWREQPEAGDLAIQALSEDQARDVVAMREEKAERLKRAKDIDAINEQRRLLKEEKEREAAREAALANPEAEVEAEAVSSKDDGKFKIIEAPFIVKADVSGSTEAVVDAVSALGNDMIRTKILRSGIGAVSEFDIDHAAAAKGSILAFNLDVSHDIKSYAKQHSVPIISNNVIYRLTDTVKSTLESLLPPIITHRDLGLAEILQTFTIKGPGRTTTTVAGCRIKNGTIARNSLVKVVRGEGEEGGGQVIFEGKLSSLKHQKKNVESMGKTGECGMSFEGWEGFQEGDVVRAYEIVSTPRTL